MTPRWPVDHAVEGKGPLQGVRVLDLTRALSGPYATLMLADAGATVIKVEQPGSGDDSRGWGPPFVGPPGEQESAYFLAINRSKDSVTLDLKDPEDLDRLRELVAASDVLVENFRPGVMDRLGLSQAELERWNPQLVVLSITGFGEGGPDGDRAGFDQIIQGEAGLMSVTGTPESGPTKFGLPITDVLSGMFGAYGVLAALWERERSGKGQRVTTSLLASAVAVQTYQATRWTVGGEEPGRDGNHHATIAPYGTFRCADGWLNIAAASESLWQRFARCVGIDPDDRRFRTNRERVEHRATLSEEIERKLLPDTVERWHQRLAAIGVPSGRIRSIPELYDSAQVEHLGLVDEVTHPTLGSLRLPGTPLRWTRSGQRTAEPPPRLGQHTDATLAELPGFTDG